MSHEQGQTYDELNEKASNVGYLLCWANANWDENGKVLWHLSASENALTVDWKVPIDGKNHKYNLFASLKTDEAIATKITDEWLIPFEEFKEEETKENLQKVGTLINPDL